MKQNTKDNWLPLILGAVILFSIFITLYETHII